MNAGDTFFFQRPVDIHLWVIISDPNKNADKIVAVHFSSWEDRHDQSCILDAGEHPFIKHKSVVSYDRAQVLSANAIQRMMNAGHITSHAPISVQLLKKIRECMAGSRLKMGLVMLIGDQI